MPVINDKKACSLLDIVLVEVTNVELKFSLLLTIVAADIASDADISLLLDSPPANAVNVDGVGDSLVVIPLLEMALTEAAFKVELIINDTEVSSLRAVVITGTTEYSSLFIAVLTEVILCKDVCLLLDVGVTDIGDVVIPLVDISLVNVIDCAVKDCSLLDITLLILVIDNVDTPVLLDTETSAVINGKLCLLTEITLVELRSLFVVLLVEVTVSTGVTVISLFDTTMAEVTDNVDNISILVDTTPVNVIAVILVLDGTLVGTGDNEGVNVILDTALVDVTDGAVVEILVNKLVCLLFDNDMSNDAGVSTLLDSELVLFFIDGIEVPSLLEMILTEVAADDKVLETELVNTSDEGVVLGIVEFSLLFMTVLVEVTICAEVNVVFDATVVEVTDDVDIILLFDTVPVGVINWAVKGCPLLDMIFILLTDDADIELSDSETSTVNVALVGTTDVELISLFVSLVAEATVCAELSSLLNTALVDVPDNEKFSVVVLECLLVIDGTDNCSELT